MAPLRWQIATFDELSNRELYHALRLRSDVFVLEQSCLYRDMDDLDQGATHILCWRGSSVTAYLRCLAPGVSYAESSLGRVVVAPAGRGLQLGRELVRRGIDYNCSRWPDRGIQIGAQSYLETFYRSMGFVSVGEQYMEDGILHRHMIRAPEEK